MKYQKIGDAVFKFLGKNCVECCMKRIENMQIYYWEGKKSYRKNCKKIVEKGGKKLQVFTKIFILFFVFFLFINNFSILTLAHCPLCTAATTGLVVATRWFGVDDLIVGNFIGAAIISSAMWFDRILKNKKRKEYLKFQSSIIILSSILLTILTFYFAGILGNEFEHYLLFGVDKILIGFLIGSIVTLFSFYFNNWLRNHNGGKSYFPFQVIIITLIFLFLTSYLFYLLGLI